MQNNSIKEFHLFAGIGGGIYGGQMLRHKCIGGCEIDSYAQKVLKQRQKDKWIEPFDIYDDITKLNGKDFQNTFDVLCGGFPCQAFSHAAHGKNIKEKNLWPYMLQFIKDSDAPVVFGENVTLTAIETAKQDLENLGYEIQLCRLSCADLNADHKRPRFWLLAVKNKDIFYKIANQIKELPIFKACFWETNPNDIQYPAEIKVKKHQIRGVGNAQAPVVAATAFRILVNRFIDNKEYSVSLDDEELNKVFKKSQTWIQKNYPEDDGFVHTPTTMGNYHCKSMMKHQCCRKYVKIFKEPNVLDAEYLMGFPIGASSTEPQSLENYNKWLKQI